MTHEFRKVDGDAFHEIYVIQPQGMPEDGKFQRIIARHPVFTHRPAVKWVQVKRGGNNTAWELLVYSEEIPLAEVQKNSDNFEKMGMDSMRWLIARHNIKLVEPPRVAGDDKTERGERANMLRGIRDFARSDAGQAVKPVEVVKKETASTIAQDIKDMTDNELEEAAALVGELPSKWGMMKRVEREQVYARARLKKQEMQEALS